MSNLTEAEVYDSLDKVKRYIDIVAEENSRMKHRIQRQKLTIKHLVEQLYHYRSDLDPPEYKSVRNHIPLVDDDMEEESPEPHPPIFQ